jgi:hypothetical protein
MGCPTSDCMSSTQYMCMRILTSLHELRLALNKHKHTNTRYNMRQEIEREKQKNVEIIYSHIFKSDM